jgi:hypothetical protein
MTVGWKPTTLSEIANQEEIRVSSERTGGGYRRWTPIWIVRVGDELYVRSGFGANGSWYRHATNSQAYIKAAGTLYEVGLKNTQETRRSHFYLPTRRAQRHRC